MKKISLCAGPESAAAGRFWNIASTGEDSGEIVLYGDVLPQKPRSWWTGEEKKGLYITPEGFMEDLETVRGKRNITIKINSCGGDLYSGIAIHNIIKGLPGHKTVIVEGIAASAASVIACAGDEVQVYPGSIWMIHGVSATLFDQYSREDLEKVYDVMEAGEKAIAEIYRVKTGKEVDELRQLMREESWYIGQEIVDQGFAETLLEEKAVETEVSADHKFLLVAGAKHNIEGFHNVPTNFKTKTDVPLANQTGHKTEKVSKEEKNLTKEELKNRYPELIAQIVADAESSAAERERKRIQDIEAIQSVIGDSALIEEAKYGKELCNAETLAFRAMQKQAKLGENFLQNMMQDNRTSGEANVSGIPSGREGQGTDEGEKVKALVNEYNTLMKGE